MSGRACPGVDVAHVPTHKGARGERTYFLFPGAEDGCLECVKHLIQNENLDPLSTSTRAKYTAAAFAEWSRKHGGEDPDGCRRVMKYLEAISCNNTCAGLDRAHQPTQSGARSGERKYFLFQAAQDGCLQCVKHVVENEGVHPLSTSSRAKYTAAAFAEWSTTHGGEDVDGCRRVMKYLDEAVARTNAAPFPNQRKRKDKEIAAVDI